MVSRVYVEKKPGFDGEARALAAELRDIVGISGLTGVRLVNRYDVEGATRRAVRRLRAHGVLRAAVRHRHLRAARGQRRGGVRRGVSARPVRPARRLGERVHPAHQPGRASRCALGGGVLPGRRSDRRRRGGREALRHQPGGGAARPRWTRATLWPWPSSARPTWRSSRASPPLPMTSWPASSTSAAWPWIWPTSSSAAPTSPRRAATPPSPRSR